MLTVLIVACWVAGAVFVLALCRAAARADIALGMKAPTTPQSPPKQHSTDLGNQHGKDAR